jgi:lipoprotein signal peptidase
MEFGSWYKGYGLLVTLSLALSFLGSVTLDQVSKQHMHETLMTWEDPLDSDKYSGRHVDIAMLGSKSLLQNPDDQYVSLAWQYSRNKGAAFSMFSDLSDQVRVPLFYVITALAVIMIFFYLRSTPANHYFTRFGLIMVLSGALGNFIDRLHRGYVVDFISVDWSILGWHHEFAIFNVADVAINIGVISMLIDAVVHRHGPVATKPKTAA